MLSAKHADRLKGLEAAIEASRAGHDQAARQSFTRGLAHELGPRDITANLVQPGSTDTDMNPADGEFSDVQRSLIPLGRFGAPADVATTVAFLAMCFGVE